MNYLNKYISYKLPALSFVSCILFSFNLKLSIEYRKRVTSNKLDIILINCYTSYYLKKVM